jgi:hypothetical protein
MPPDPHRSSEGHGLHPRSPQNSWQQAAAGCSPRTVELIRNQDAPLDPDFGELLRLADEAN